MISGHELAGAMWALTALSLVLVTLRLYTRIRIVKFVGVEDYLYACTGLLILCFTIFIQVAVDHGLGTSFWVLSLAESSDAIFWTYVANTFAITGNAMAKLSMGLFLLRVVQVRWQKIVLWVVVFLIAATSLALAVMLWNQTTPVKASWDPLRTPGKWNIQIQPMSVGLGVWSSICDFFFAIFPWLFLWSLPMPQKEKIMLASGMSLGIIAGACGIVRTIVLARLNVMDYTINFVPYFAWAGGEIAVSMICIGIPTLRPLYLKARGITSSYGRNGQSQTSEMPSFKMCEPKLGHSPGPRIASAASHARTDSTLTAPASTYTKASSRNSIDELSTIEEGGGNRIIWVANEVRVPREDMNWPLRS
ncbi:hypothetical protein BJ166DRAFT_493020 [Pestalotiopsis sp. NC0098]|nr:hypothetical protein BJ166DRAFT_493020 [Pestalotiopsis sp. NC0098]